MLHTLLWGAFLASSWTWCIGMFLPVLLVRDFGLLGYLIFALPNCLGAGAMGWVLRSPSASATLVNRHTAALRLFSLVTIAFHAFFLAWLLSASSSQTPGASAVPLLATSVVIAVLVGVLPGVWQGVVALGLWATVLGVGWWWVSDPGAHLAGASADAPKLMPDAPLLPLGQIAYLAPVCAFGFALCPYLDATFHRVRQETPRASGTAAFTIGFMLLFPCMILFTLLYAGLFLWNRPVGRELVLWHIALQAGFTVGVHAQALHRLSRSHRRTTARGAACTPTRCAGAVLTSVGVFWLVAIILMHTLGDRLAAAAPGSLGLGESIYRVFMGAYGMVFPAYVWLIMIPTRDGHAGLSGDSGRRKLIMLIIAIALASPLFYLGFVERQSIWLAPGLALILLSRFALPHPR